MVAINHFPCLSFSLLVFKIVKKIGLKLKILGPFGLKEEQKTRGMRRKEERRKDREDLVMCPEIAIIRGGGV